MLSTIGGGLLQGGLGLAGGLLGDKERRKGLKDVKEMASFKPWNVNSPFFNSTFDPETNTVNAGMSDSMKAFTDQIMAQMGGNLSADPQDFYNKLSQLSQSGERQQAMDLESRLFNQGRLGSTGGALQQNAMFDALNDSMLKRELNAYELQGGLFNQALQGLGQLMNVNQSALQPAGMGSGIGLNMAQVGAGLANPIMGVSDAKANMWGGLFGGMGKTLGGLF